MQLLGRQLRKRKKAQQPMAHAKNTVHIAGGLAGIDNDDSDLRRGRQWHYLG